jgi:hypothetical protein
MVGNYANGGIEWEPKGTPRRTNVHDFADPELAKAVPYGVDDVTANTGWVNVGTDADTGQVAVESIRRWWHAVGKTNYPAARRVLITADSGGSNGSRLPGSGFGRPSWPASRLRPTIVESTTVLLPHKILRQFLLRRTRWCGGRLRHGRHAVAQYTTSVGTNP